MSDPVTGPAATAATERTEEDGAASAPAPGAADPGLSAVFAALPGPTAVFAADPPHFTLLAASDALVATVGRPRAALVGRPLAEAFPDPDPPPPEGSGVASLRASLGAAVRSGRPQRMARQRYDLRLPDGTWEARYWDALNTPVPGPDGAVRAVLHQTEDVTERVRSEHAAARAEVRAARVLERMSDAHVALDRDFHVTYVNAAAERALGRPRGELLGRSHWEVFPASVDNDVGRAYRRVVAEGVAQHVRQHYVGEGYDRHLEVDAFPTDEGEGPGHGVAVFWRDVTDRVQDQAALAAFRTLVEHASDAHAIFDADGRILWANRLMAERLGHAPDALVGRHVSDIDAHYDAARYAELFARARAGRVAPFESEHRRRDGSTFPVEVTATVVALPEGERLFSAVRDITARNAARAELEAAYRRLQEQAAELEAQAEELQATAAHLEEQTETADAARRAADAERARAEAILEGTADAFFALDADFRIVAANGAMERGGGLPRAALLGRSFWEVFPGAVGTDFERHYRRASTERVAARFTHDYSDGRLELVVDVDAYPAPDGGVAVFWRDVTARVRAEAALRRSEAKYRALFASIDAGFCVIEILLDDDGRPVDYRFLETNPAFVQQTGLADAAGRTIRELAPAIEPHWAETYGRVAATGEPVRFEAPAEALGRWYDVYAFRVDRPEDRRVAVLFTDVTAQKAADRERTRLLAAERAARAEAERLAARTERLQALTAAALAAPLDRGEAAHAILREVVAAAGAAGGGVLELTADGREFVLLDLAGYDEDAVRPAYGRFPADLPTPARDAARDLRPVFLRRREDWAAGGYLPPEPSPAAAAGAAWAALPLAIDGRALGVLTLTFGEPRAFGADEQAFVMAFARQCAQAMHRAALYEAERAARGEAEAARRDAEAAQARAEAAGREADEANQAKSGFLAVMSHELRTPINAMLGYTQLLELGLAGPLTDQQRGYLDRLTASSHHLLGLVNDVLDLSKIEAGETRVAHRDATTGAATRAALDLVRPQADARGVRLVDARPDEAGVPFVGDEDRVRQVALNLLGNAVKFTPPGGTVTVTCGTEAATPAAAGHLQGAGPWAYVRVEDTGVGIPAEEQGRIFDPFHQVDSRHTRKAGGTGLGLAISRRLARLMGGDLTVESTPGAGSTFTLWLPAARRTADAQAETAAARSARAERDVARDVAALETPGLGDVGGALRASVDEVLAAYADRLRADPAVPRAREMRRVELEDHGVSFCADLAQSLVIVGNAGPEAAGMLRDGSAIQRAIAEQHGARRHVQGWDEAAVRRDHQLFREEVERAVRGRLRPAGGDAGGHAPGGAGTDHGRDRDVDAAVRVLLGLIDRAEAISVRAWRQAASHAADAGGA